MDSADEPAGKFFSEIFKGEQSALLDSFEEKDQNVVQFQNKVQAVKEKVMKAMQKNELLPAIEKLDREEFTIDFKERDRLLSIADGYINQVRTEIDTENLKKRVVRSRIKVYSCVLRD